MQDGKTYLIKKTLQKYSNLWVEQEKVFKNIGVRNPYPSPEVIDVEKLSVNEKEILTNLAESPEDEVFKRVHEVIGSKFYPLHQEKISLQEAKNKLQIELFKEVPLKETCSLRELFFAIPTGITNPPLKPEELRWLYLNGYLPHLYWNNGKPRFDRRMWFIIDFVIRQAHEEIGLGIFKKFSDWRPRWIGLRNYIHLVIYMYNSWKIGESILDYARKEAGKTGLKGEKFRIIMLGLQKTFWVNEGKAIATELIKNSNLASNHFNLIEHFRDIFALLSFEAFPGNHLIDLYHKPSLRGAVMFSFKPYMRIRTFNMEEFLNVNTYAKEELSSSYDLLFSAVDWALSMRDQVNNRSVVDIVGKFRLNENDKKGLVPCRICGELFKLVRPKMDVTCRKQECIIKNKYLSKSKNIESKMLPLVE